MTKKIILACILSPIIAFSASASETASSPIPHQNSGSGRILKSDYLRHLNFSNLGKEYSNFKDYLQKKYNLSYSLTASFTPQYGAPSGKSTAFQSLIYPSISWEMFNNRYGQMTLNAAYNVTRYSGADGEKIQNNIIILLYILGLT